MDMTLGGGEGRHGRPRGRRLTSLFAALFVALGTLAVAGTASALARTVYVTNQGGSTVTPIDTATNSAGSTISVGSTPQGIAITPGGATAWVANTGDDSVIPIDTAAKTAGPPSAVGPRPVAIAITPDGTTAYVVDNGDVTEPDPSPNVTPIDAATGSQGAPIAVGANPNSIAITPDGATAYVPNSADDDVIPIQTATNTHGPTIGVGSYPIAIAITPDGATAYVVNFGGSVTPIDVATNTAETSIAVGANPEGIAISPDGATAYVTNYGDGSVTPIDTATNTAGATIPVGSSPLGIAITPDGATAYVVNFGGTVTPIDLATNTAETPIPVGSSPVGIAITPDQPPAAAFTSDTATIGQTTSFDASASSDPDGSVTTYRWDYGDGDTETTDSSTIDHAYAGAGTYMATLTVTDDEGCASSQIFTGQTMSCNGSGVAQITHQVMVAKASPSIATSATAGIALGGSIHDTATLTSGYNPAGTITFKLYGPNDASCSHPHVFSQTRPVLGNGSYSSVNFTPTKAGTYRWTASYSGGANNEAAAGPCNAAHESVTVAKASPTLTTKASLVSRNRVGDRATLAHGASPMGQITFRLYRPGDTTCSLAPVFTNKVTVSGNGSYNSARFTATKRGTHRFTASYPGDAKNKPASSACNSRGESVMVPGG